MKLIAIVDERWGIGFNGRLLLSIPEDIRYFKEKTLHKTIIMGRHTFESLPGQKPLDNRKNIVLSTSDDIYESGIEICHSLDELFEKTANIPPMNIYVIGGESVYRQLLPYCSVAYITKIYASFNADWHMVNLDKCKSWCLIREGLLREYNGISYRFTEYARRVINR